MCAREKKETSLDQTLDPTTFSLLSAKHVCELLQIDRTTLSRYARRKYITPHYVGNKVYYDYWDTLALVPCKRKPYYSVKKQFDKYRAADMLQKIEDQMNQNRR
jgi:hypothetical protein